MARRKGIWYWSTFTEFDLGNGQRYSAERKMGDDGREYAVIVSPSGNPVCLMKTQGQAEDMVSDLSIAYMAGMRAEKAALRAEEKKP